MSLNASALHLYSMGIVTEDKIEGTDYIIVTPMEQLSDTDGSLSSTTNIGKSSGTTIKKRNTIIAKWMPDGQTNRATSPNVYKNETVKIFRYADSDKYYWNTVFHEPNIRRLEHVVYSYSNKKTPLETYDDNSSYYMTWSTLKKYIHLHTSTNDGEQSGYDIKIDTKDGIITVIDTQNNELKWNSVSKHLDITGFNEFNVNVNNQINMTAGSITNITSPTINLNGNVNISKNLSVSGSASMSGDISTSGSVSATGTVTGSNIG